MGLFDNDPEKKQAKEAERAMKDAQKQEQAFWASPVGKARAAYQKGDRFFEVDIPHSELNNAVTVVGNVERTKQHQGGTDVLGAIAAEGWHLIHAGWVFIETGTDSRDKFLASGQQTVTKGRVVGIYLFERIN